MMLKGRGIQVYEPKSMSEYAAIPSGSVYKSVSGSFGIKQ